MYVQTHFIRSEHKETIFHVKSTNINDALTSSVTADRLQHLEADASDIYLRRRNSEVEALGKVGRVRSLDGRRPLHFHRATMLTQRDAHVRVGATLAELEGTSQHFTRQNTLTKELNWWASGIYSVSYLK